MEREEFDLKEHNKVVMKRLEEYIQKGKFETTVKLPILASLPKGTDETQLLKPIIVREEMKQLLTELQVFISLTTLN
jgi:hypothetical protein